MKEKNFNSSHNKIRILVAPLDWGLGHATRCIPIISKLLQQNCDVIVAAEAAGKFLLQKEFPNLIFVDLKGYRIQYSSSKIAMPFKMLAQLPKLVYRVYSEKLWLNKAITQYSIDAVISDNRLGLSCKKVMSIYITHQLLIKTGNAFTEKIAQKIHYYFINKYNACWVPDAKGEINLAGDLSHPKLLPAGPVKYLGPLSRFKKLDVDIKYDVCILLSGPEPQRTIFEKKFIEELKTFSGKAFLLRGCPGDTKEIKLGLPEVEVKNHLSADELNIVIQQSKLIISRSGYTTVMDLAKLQHKALLVPTPGQTEQEYLAEYVEQKQIFYTLQQKDFSLKKAFEKVNAFEFKNTALLQNEYDVVVEYFVAQLQKANQ
jgi:uncharacterized protein (TIGR00661 family)